MIADQRHAPPIRSARPRWLPLVLVGAAAVALGGAAVGFDVGRVHDDARDAVRSVVSPWLGWGVVACLLYLLTTYAAFLFMLPFSIAESIRRNRERRAEDFETLEISRFTIPVSVVLTVYNEASLIVASTRSLLAQEYSEFEVIVVDDGSTDGTAELLEREFDLEPRELFYRRRFETCDVVAMYRSRTHPRLTVVRKLNGGKADALNCGLNLARYRYIAGVDGDTVYQPDALLKGMRLAMRDPALVVGVTSHIAISYRPEVTVGTAVGRRRVDASVLSNFQHIDYLRSFLNNRLAWSRLGFMLCTVGAFHIWRRDVLEELGGFSSRFTCEDIEMTFRVHETFRRTGRPYAVLSLPETIATTEGPDRIRGLIKQRARWQRVIAETVWHYRGMLGNPRYGAVGLVGVPFYLVTEALAPLFELLAVLLLGLALWVGDLDWLAFAALVGLMAMMNGFLTAVAVMIEDATTRAYRLRDLVRLLVVAPLDPVVYRPILTFARLRGTWDFLRGRRDWDKFERNPREAAVTNG